ncbi:MAG TPA: 23S rRNA (guanosine(2251)-2'-O)-methyltransferase RlmB [Acidimicrobiia bacterium]|nr:23S rRNA (guanosine(2251)-2'-O)-methyltransferase RlmB [Acidimicrobiia bacterium]
MTRRRGDDLGGAVVPGRRAVAELLRAGRRPVRMVSLARSAGRVADELAELAAAAGARVRWRDADQLREESGVEATQGVVARAAPVTPAPLAGLLEREDAFLVALDGVTDPRNLGAVLRTALAAGASGAILPRHRAALLTPAAVKAAAGAVEHLPVALVGGVATALDQAGRAGVWTVGLDARGEALVSDLAVADRPLVLVLGAEDTGLARLVRARCDVVARVPMPGPVESLNVAAAAAVACFEVARQRAG